MKNKSRFKSLYNKHNFIWFKLMYYFPAITKYHKMGSLKKKKEPQKFAVLQFLRLAI